MSYPLPKMCQVIANGVKSANDVALQALRAGVIKTKDVEIKRRLSLCQGCEYYRPEDERCAHIKCGCFVKLKTWLNASRCPEGKW